MSHSIGNLRALALAASLFSLALAACSEPSDPPAPPAGCAATETACGTACCTADQVCDAASTTCKPKSESPQCQATETVCGQECCTASQTCDQATSTCKAKEEPPQCQATETACGQDCCTENETCDAAGSTCRLKDAPDQLPRCYSPASLPANGFASDEALVVDEDGYEYLANHKVDATYAQMLSIGLWPLSETTQLKGSFDLSQEPLSYARCERCVLVIAGKSETDQKHYLASGGTLNITELSDTKIAGSLTNVRLVEVTINESTLATAPVEGGCEIEIPSLSFSYEEPTEPVDPRIEECFLRESFESTSFSDYVWAYEANDSGYFYRAMELPATNGLPTLTLFVEVYEDGTGTYNMAGCETNSASCYHYVIIEAQTPYDGMKSYVGRSGRLVLTELSEEAMVGRIEDVELVETVIDGSNFTPVSGGCTATIPSLEFSSRNETVL